MIDLRPDQLATVRAILQAEVPECEVWVFGSRAKWTAKDSSDLDLALVASERLPSPKLGRLREAFKDSYLPIKVDVVDIHRVSEEFRKIIEAQKVVLQTPSAVAAGQADRSRWQTLPLEQCIETLIDYRGKTPTKVSTGIPLITAKIVKNGRIETPDEFIAEEDYEGWMRRGFPQAGDVLLTMEAPLGEVAQLDNRKVALAQRLVALRGKQGLLDNWYLKYLLQSDLVQDQLKSRATGTTVLGIKQSELRKINLTLPPLDEQRAMAQVLGTLDDKIELNRRMNETLEALSQSLFKSWFVDAIQFALPAGWSIGKLADIADIVMGLSPEGESYNTDGIGVPLINGPVEFGDYFPVKAKWTTSPTRMAEAGDLIFCVRGSTTGRRVISDGAYCLGRGVCGMRAKNGATTFLYQAINHGLLNLLTKTTGSVFPSLSAPDIKNCPVVLPPQQIIDHFSEQTEPLTKKLQANIVESRTLTTLRDALLPKLLSGELHVTPGQMHDTHSQ
jgi:type I restriction enzyme S subunit